MKAERIFGFAVGAVVVVSVVVAFLAIGSPHHARSMALDGRRVADIGLIASVLYDHYGDGRKPLPKHLMNDDPSRLTRDPATNRPFEYEILSKTHYLICATFDAPRDRSPNESGSLFWNHGAGRACYTFDVSKVPPDIDDEDAD